MLPIYVFVLVFLLIIFSGFRILAEYERGVIFRLGRLAKTRGAGLNWIIPFVDRMVRVDLRTVTMDIPPQDVITKDNVSVTVNAVLYFRVVDPERANVEVENYLFATGQLAQTTLRSVCGNTELDELLTDREKINTYLQEILDVQTDPWGVKVSAVEVKHIDLPTEMQRAMARQAEAERDRRAKVINAEGELQASKKLSEAARVIGDTPTGIQLRYLQTISEVASEKSTHTIIPFPMEVLDAFKALVKDKK
jgi:regulator of protease activity HflC (stomatin/prohibitin superfamily)